MNTPGMKDIIRKAYENGVLTEQDACYFQACGIPGRPDGMNFNCRSMGEAAGIAAAMAVKNEAVRFNEIDGTAVRREIRLPDKFYKSKLKIFPPNQQKTCTGKAWRTFFVLCNFWGARY